MAYLQGILSASCKEVLLSGVSRFVEGAQGQYMAGSLSRERSHPIIWLPSRSAVLQRAATVYVYMNLVCSPVPAGAKLGGRGVGWVKAEFVSPSSRILPPSSIIIGMCFIGWCWHFHLSVLSIFFM
jgi:predicted DNA-binding transcriptional regulator AlpA